MFCFDSWMWSCKNLRKKGTMQTATISLRVPQNSCSHTRQWGKNGQIVMNEDFKHFHVHYQFPGLYFSAHTPAGALHKSLSKSSILTLLFTAFFQILLNQTLLVPWGQKPPVSPMAEWTPGWQCDQRPCRGVSTAPVPFVMSRPTSFVISLALWEVRKHWECTFCIIWMFPRSGVCRIVCKCGRIFAQLQM